MEYFYDEQIERLDYQKQEKVLFQDMICQVFDMLRPETIGQITMKDLLKNKQNTFIFLNYLTNVNKMIEFENRDPYQHQQEITDTPGYNDWDRFAQQEYLRLTSEDENQENFDDQF